MAIRLRDMRFGIELEFSSMMGDVERSVHPLINRFFGQGSLRIDWNGSNPQKTYNVWRLKNDESTECELASPISNLHDLGRIGKFIAACRKIAVTSYDGFHVHVGMRGITTESQLVASWLLTENTLFKCFPPNRRSNNFCRHVDPRPRKRKKLVADVFESAIVQALAHEMAMSTSPCKTKGTVEFRLGEGTLDHHTVRNWVKFLLYFVRWSSTMEMEYLLCRPVGWLDTVDGIVNELRIRDTAVRQWLEYRYSNYGVMQ